MLVCITFESLSPIISAIIGSGAAFWGVWFSFSKWKEEKNIQRETELKDLLIKVVGKCFGNMDYVELQYRKFLEKCKSISNEEKVGLFAQLQKETELYVKEAEELLNEAELRIENDDLIKHLKEVEGAFVAIISACSKEGEDLSNDKLTEYSNKKKVFILASKSSLHSENEEKTTKHN